MYNVSEDNANVLLLAMSRPDIQTSERNLESILNLVKDKSISMMDGRDMYRIIKTEKQFNVRCYTVSLEQNNVAYADSHMSYDCSNKMFISKLREKFVGIQFQQIIFDWFWFPLSWFQDRFHRRFFSTTLIEFATRNILTGTIYFPFNVFFIENIVCHRDLIEQHYKICMLKTHSKRQSYLWKSTMDIEHHTLQQLGKEPNQEKMYSRITKLSLLKHRLDGRHVKKEEVVEFVTHKIKGNDISEITTICLKRI